MLEIANALALAVGLGLLAFVEPCSVGSHLLFLKYLDQRPAAERALQTVLFTVTRAGLMAALGILAALVGAQFTGIQQGLWIVLGSLYIALGLVYLLGGASWLIRQVNRVLPHLPDRTGSFALGGLFGLNVPACAAPLLAVLLGDTAARAAAAGGGMAYGGVTLLVFGLALSSPLILAVLTRRGRRVLDGIATLAARMPRWTGAVLVLLGGWSILLAFS